jgi:tetratricopeptide (TPR) repeat protein
MKAIYSDSSEQLMQLIDGVFDEGIAVILKSQSFDVLLTHLQKAVIPLAVAMVASETDKTGDMDVDAKDAAMDRVIRGVATEIAFYLWNATPVLENNFRPRSLPRPERNAPCPCGSGKKYKQCCDAVPSSGLQMPASEMAARVAAKLPKERIGEILSRDLPAHMMGIIADKWLSAARSEDVIALLEPYLADLDKLDERATLAADTLIYAYLHQARAEQHQRFINHLKTASNKKLRSLAYLRDALLHSDRQNPALAREAYKQAEKLYPDNPELAYLDILLLLADGKPDQARERIRFWAEKLSPNPDFDFYTLTDTLYAQIAQWEYDQKSSTEQLPDDYPEKRLILHIGIERIDPPIWRRIEVENILTFSELHWIIQTVMGWDNEHLYEFEVGDYRIGPPSEDMFGNRPILPDNEVEIGQVLGRKKTFYYHYDFGDDWRHKITVEKRLPPNEDIPQALLIDGERACPPEDCGGVSGYYHILDAKTHPRRAENREYLEYFRDFKPEVFKPAGIHKKLKMYFD